MNENIKGLVLGAAGGIVTALLVLSVYFVASANAKGADGGDWLTFAGVFFGVGATVGTALGIDWVKKKIAYRAAVAQTRPTLTVWRQTIGDNMANLNAAKIADLRQQHAYISVISRGLASEAIPAMAIHTFTFHVPAMINRLEAAMSEPGAQRAVTVAYVTNEMLQYATTVEQALSA